MNVKAIITGGIFLLTLSLGEAEYAQHNPMKYFVKDKSSPMVRGAILNQSGDYPVEGYGPLVNAAIFGYEGVVEILSQDNNVLSHEGGQALHAAATMGEYHVARILLEKGVSANSHVERNITPIFGAAEYGEYRVLCLLLMNGGNVNDKADVPYTLLELAILSGNIRTVKIILLNGYSPVSEKEASLYQKKYGESLVVDMDNISTTKGKKVIEYCD